MKILGMCAAWPGLLAFALSAAAEDGAAAGPPREISLFGDETALLPPLRDPAAAHVLQPLAPRAPKGTEAVPPAPPDAEVRRLMGDAVDLDPTAAEAAKALLAGVPPRSLLSNGLWALRDREAKVRLGGVAALRAMDRPEAVQPLVSRVLYERGAEVRRAMAAALGALPDPKGEADAYLRNKILTGDRATRIRTAEVMGWTRRRGYVEILVTTYRKITGRSNRAHIFVGTQGGYVDDYDVQVTAGAFALDPHIGYIQYGIALETMVIKIEEEWQEIERRYIRDALADITGVDVGKDPAALERWMKGNGGPAAGGFPRAGSSASANPLSPL